MSYPKKRSCDDGSRGSDRHYKRSRGSDRRGSGSRYDGCCGSDRRNDYKDYYENDYKDDYERTFLKKNDCFLDEEHSASRGSYDDFYGACLQCKTIKRLNNNGLSARQGLFVRRGWRLGTLALFLEKCSNSFESFIELLTKTLKFLESLSPEFRSLVNCLQYSKSTKHTHMWVVFKKNLSSSEKYTLDRYLDTILVPGKVYWSRKYYPKRGFQKYTLSAEPYMWASNDEPFSSFSIDQRDAFCRDAIATALKTCGTSLKTPEGCKNPIDVRNQIFFLWVKRIGHTQYKLEMSCKKPKNKIHILTTVKVDKV